MKVVFILVVTAIVICVGNRMHKVHRHRHAYRESRPERNVGSIMLKPGTAKNKLFPGYGTNFRYIGEVKNGLDRVTVVTSIPIPKYDDIVRRPLIFSKCTVKLDRKGARTPGKPRFEVYRWCSKVQAQVNHYKSQESELLFILRQLLNHDLYSVLPELKQTPSMHSDKPSDDIKPKDTLDLSDFKYKIDSEYESLKSNNRDKRGLGKCGDPGYTRTDHPGCREY